MSILVTGSSGQLGRAIVSLLQAQGYEAVGVDLSPSDTTQVVADIRSWPAVQDLTKRCKAVIHTAAVHGKHFELGYPREEFVQTNICGTLNLLNGCVQNGVGKFLYTSTTSIYGQAMVSDNQAVWVTEDLVPHPRDIYDITKLTAELLCRDYFEKEGIESTVLRVSRFLPESDNLKAIHRLYRGLSEEDGARAHLLALHKQFSEFEIFNVSNQSPFQLEDLTTLYRDPRSVILKYFPIAEEVFSQRGWAFPKQIDRVYVIDKAIAQLGYTPQYNFETFLSEV